jgi:pyruvate dehydrogenase (quinone)
MGRIAAEDLIERLADWGVDTIFGLPGDGINGLMEAIRRSERIRFVLVQHEEAAAFMATAHAKATGRIGVCLATSGPGGIHLLNGLYDAKLDHAPVLAITGLQESAVLGSGYQQEVALDKLYSDVAVYDLVVANPAQLPGVVDLAIRAAYAHKGVAHLTVPADVQVSSAGDDPYRGVAQALPPSSSPVFVPGAGLPRAEDLERAAEVLNGAEKPAILAGAGALGARSEILQLADILGAPVVKTLPGKAAIPDDSEFSVGGLGLLGTRPGEKLVQDCDVLFLIGTNYPYTKHLPKPGSVRVVQLEESPERAGSRLPSDALLVGDAAAGLRALLPLLSRRSDRSHLEDYQSAMADWRESQAASAPADKSPISPQYAISVLDELASDDAVLACDSGTVTTWAARRWTIRGRREFYVSSNLASMACALPYANAIALAHPGRQVIAYAGDGGFAMLMAEFLTAARYGLPIKVVVNNNNSLGMILWEQLQLGYPESGIRFEEPVPDYSAWARACGAFGEKVTEPGDVRGAVERALAHPGPALLDIDVDPSEPPLPPGVTAEQAKGFVTAFLKGQPEKGAIAGNILKDAASVAKGILGRS